MTDEEILSILDHRFEGLPELENGNLWAIRVYPGGRRELVQVHPSMVHHLDTAKALLSANRKVHVGLADAVKLEREVKVQP